jgi:hypothetical protein
MPIKRLLGESSFAPESIDERDRRSERRWPACLLWRCSFAKSDRHVRSRCRWTRWEW